MVVYTEGYEAKCTRPAIHFKIVHNNLLSSPRMAGNLYNSVSARLAYNVLGVKEVLRK